MGALSKSVEKFDKSITREILIENSKILDKDEIYLNLKDLPPEINRDNFWSYNDISLCGVFAAVLISEEIKIKRFCGLEGVYFKLLKGIMVEMSGGFLFLYLRP